MDVNHNVTDPVAMRIRFLIVFVSVCAVTVGMTGCVTPATDQPEEQPSVDEQLTDNVLSETDVRSLNQFAIQLLEKGRNKESIAYLERSASLAPNQQVAFILLEQLSADPVQQLGREWYEYVVAPNETLSSIAESVLGNPLKFVILARYNNISDPSSLPADSVIKIPGNEPRPFDPPRAPIVDAEVLRDQADSAERDRDLRAAYDLTAHAIELEPGNEELHKDLLRRRNLLIDLISKEAYVFEELSEIGKAIQLWEQVLELDPESPYAKINIKELERLRSKQ